MTDFVSIGIGAAIGAFVLGRALESSGRARRLRPELAGPPQTPPSLYPRIDTGACICTGACVDACPEQDVLAVIAGRPRLVRPSACVGHADCLRSCPVSAIELVLGSPERAVEVPVVSSAFETTVPGLHVAGEITGIGLIHNALAQGRQAARAALDSAAGAGSAGAHDCAHDLVVIGAGPAGLGAALEARARGARCTVFEKSRLGGAIQSYPRQKVVMSAPFDLPGLGKVKLRRTSKQALLDLFDDVIRSAQLAIVERAEVTAITPLAGRAGFHVQTTACSTTAHRVVLAIGRRGTPRRLGVPGDDLPHVIHDLDDAAHHAGQRIVVVGGGDSAVEAALALAAQPATTVTLVHRGTDFGRCKPDNQGALETALDTASGAASGAAGRPRRAPAHRPARQPGPRRDRGSRRAATPGGVRAVAATRVVCCLGAELPSRWLRGLGIELRELRGEPLH